MILYVILIFLTPYIIIKRFKLYTIVILRIVSLPDLFPAFLQGIEQQYLSFQGA